VGVGGAQGALLLLQLDPPQLGVGVEVWEGEEHASSSVAGRCPLVSLASASAAASTSSGATRAAALGSVGSGSPDRACGREWRAARGRWDTLDHYLPVTVKARCMHQRHAAPLRPRRAAAERGSSILWTFAEW
jgi:hypothetical protein